MTGAIDRGAHFRRTDFQVHTPRDAKWKGVGATSDIERQTYAVEFVAHCRSTGLRAVAITDHHDLLFAPIIRKAAAEELDDAGEPVPESDQLVVFPGIELTLALGRQALLILDVDFPEDRLSEVLTALAITPVVGSESKLPDVQPLDGVGSFAELHDKLNEHAWLRGRFIVLPNVTDSGHKTILRKGMSAEYKGMPCIGGYLDGSVESLGTGNTKILSGEDAAWGNKRLAVFQTSDARSRDFASLGQPSTWVKWAEPTAEAIRQACLAQESRISHTEPALPNVWISRVVVTNSKFLGRVDVAINPQYTSLIGGRGTGKSTVLDYLRWALCDQPAEATEDDEVANPRVRQRNLIEATLKPYDAHVEVHCEINGITHVVRRHAKDGSVQLKVSDAEFEDVRESAIQSLLPIQAYSQKQLSSVAIRVDELLRFVTSPIQRQLEDIDRKQQEIAGRLRENYGTVQRFRTLSAEVERSDLRVKSLVEQAKSLREGLAGLSDDDREILDGKAAHDDTRAALSEWQDRIAGVDEDLEGVSASIQAVLDGLTRPAGVPEDLDADTDSYLVAARSALEAALDAVSGSRGDLDAKRQVSGAVGTAAGALATKLGAFDERYSAVKQRSSAHETKLAELARLEEQQREARDLVQKQRSELQGLGKPLEFHQQLRSELAGVRKERTAALASQCEALSASSDGLIRAALSVGQGFDAVQVRFKGLIAGSNVRSARTEAFFESLTKESDPLASWETVLDELEWLATLEPDRDVTSEQTPTLSRLDLPVADQKKIAAKLTSDGWLDLSLVESRDTPVFEYRAKESDYIPFASASAGQQASALLSTLLALDGSPLIIDQPEDDLDSDTVQQIVSKIWQSKGRRQLLFSSHNANLVVNGDADLVLVCAYVNAGDQSAGHIKTQGAIDIADVRDAITSVMEGGEKAFRLRKEKYGF